MNEHTMMNCGSEPTKLYCEDYAPDDCNKCPNWTPQKPHTRADSIKAMTDEELAEWLCDIASCRHCPISKEKACSGGLHVSYSYCGGRWLDWLRQEAEAYDARCS